MNQTLSPAPPRPSDATHSLALLDQAARLTIRLAGGIDRGSLRFSERQRLTRILNRLKVAGGER